MIILEIMCEKMIEELRSTLKQIEDNEEKASNLFVNDRQKELLEYIAFPKKQIDAHELGLIRYQLVRVVFLFYLKIKCFYLNSLYFL